MWWMAVRQRRWPMARASCTAACVCVLRSTCEGWPVLLLAALLLLKSAMPWLASLAAQAQGKDLVQICTEHGVKLVAAENPAQQSPAPQLSSAANEHCPLNGLCALASPPSTEIGPIPAAWRQPAATLQREVVHVQDACATWAARLEHGPPSLA